MTNTWVLCTALPPTKGHADIVKFAESLGNTHVRVLLCTQPDEPMTSERRGAVMDLTVSSYYTQILYYDSPIQQVPKDDKDTAFWQTWRRILQNKGFHEGDTIVASDSYGKKLAEVMNAHFMPYDPDRSMRPGCATDVRKDPLKNFSYILPSFQSFLRKRITIFGAESCLDADTFINFEKRTKKGRRQNSKGGSIETLWYNFHNKLQPGSGRYLRPQTLESEYFAPCMNDEGRIFMNQITDVVDTGLKNCFTVTTSLGYEITGTADHKFHSAGQYVCLSDLDVGDEVSIHNGTRYECDGRADNNKYDGRLEITLEPIHPKAGLKTVTENGIEYRYSRIRRNRAVYEAHMNGLTLEEYRAKFKNHDIAGMIFLDTEDHIHHLDENPLNDDINNLELISASEHGRLHALERHNNLRFTVVTDKITKIQAVGERHTYDIKMLTPYHNYVADKFVVHNCGKTTLANALATALDGIAIPEYARPYLEMVGSDITVAKMKSIHRGQKVLQKQATDLALDKPFIFQDTDLFSTLGYWHLWNDGPEDLSLMFDARSSKSDLYIVCPSNIPFEQDPLRYGGKVRESTDDYWINLCKNFDLNYKVLTTKSKKGRLEEATKLAVDLFNPSQLAYERVK